MSVILSQVSSSVPPVNALQVSSPCELVDEDSSLCILAEKVACLVGTALLWLWEEVSFLVCVPWYAAECVYRGVCSLDGAQLKEVALGVAAAALMVIVRIGVANWLNGAPLFEGLWPQEQMRKIVVLEGGLTDYTLRSIDVPQKSLPQSSQYIMQFAQWIFQIPFAPLKWALATICVSHVVILGPVFEEIAFRLMGYQSGEHDAFLASSDSLLHRFLKVIQTDCPDDSLAWRVYRVVKNGVIFALVHLPFQTSAYMTVFWSVMPMGCLFALLREITGRITAPIAAHVTMNTYALARLARGL